jgi:hypothetical protein
MQDKIEVTKEQFMAFERIRKSGVCNMFDAAVQRMGGFSKAVHLAIIGQYNELEQKYPGVRKEGD